MQWKQGNISFSLTVRSLFNIKDPHATNSLVLTQGSSYANKLLRTMLNKDFFSFNLTASEKII